MSIMIEWVGGLENPPKHAYVIFEWSLRELSFVFRIILKNSFMFVLLRLVSEIRIGMGFMLNIVASCLKRMHKYKVSNKFLLIAMSV